MTSAFMNPTAVTRTVQITGVSINPAKPLTHSLHVKFTVDNADVGSVSPDKKSKSIQCFTEKPFDLHSGSQLSVYIREKHRLRDKTFPRVDLFLEDLIMVQDSEENDIQVKRFKQSIWLNFKLPSSENAPHGPEQTEDPLKANMEAAIALLNEFEPILDRLGRGQDILDIGLKFAEVVSPLHPIADAVVKCFTFAFDKMKDQSKGHENVFKLAESMLGTIGHVRTVEKIAKLNELKKTLVEFPDLIKRTVELIKKLVKQGLFLNLVLTSYNNKEIDELQGYHDNFIERFDRGVKVDEAVKVDYLADEGELKELEKYLSKGIKTVKEVADKCIDGTRTAILADVAANIDDPDGANIIWIRGAPGSGKSSTSLSTKSRLKHKKRLVTYFRFDRTQASTTTIALWQHVALCLARKFPSIHTQLLLKARDDRVDLDSASDVFKNLIQEPLLNMTESPSEGPLTIVIDGLDECGGLDGWLSSDRRDLRETLEEWSKLPKHVPVKLLVTSREEADLHRVLSEPPISVSIHIPSGSTLVDDPTSQSSKNASQDIQTFLEYRFRQTVQRLSLACDWPGATTITQMTQRAVGNFMWVVTATNFIDLNLDPNEGIELIMGSTSAPDGMETLYSLYSTILNTSFQKISDSNAETVRIVLGTMVYAKRPLSDEEYSKLPTTKLINPTILRSIREGLGSVIVADGDLRFVHKSFDDFLLSTLCPPRFAIDEGKIQSLLARLCILTMSSDSGLRFNMCNLETSSLKNVDIPEVDAKVKAGISGLLSYSCRFWADHLSCIPFNGELMLEVNRVLRDKLLYWFEAMSLLKEMNRVSHALLSVLDWSKSSSDVDFKAFMRDARQFIGAFIYPITQSAAHIYISALPFAPEQSHIVKCFLPLFPRTLSLSKGKPINWSSCLFTSEHHKRAITAVAFPPDEKFFISGFYDGSICISDAETGNLVSGPFQESQYQVLDACFSPDGRRIWTSHYDGQVIGWDVDKDNVNKHIAFMAGQFSFDLRCCCFNGGQNIVSLDPRQRTVGLWSAENGKQLQDPFEIPADTFTSPFYHTRTSFSPDGGYLAWAGAGSTAIRIWKVDARSEVKSRTKIQGHKKPITALSFSVDSLYVVTGAEDGTIVVWNTKTAEPAGRPLVIGQGEVSAVAYSHVNRLIVSASGFPGTMTIWNASTQQAILGPLGGHTSYINAIMFLQDGRRALSRSSDGTVRMWDLGQNGALDASRATDGSTEEVECIAFTPCGQRLALLGAGRALRVLDMTSGEELVHHIDVDTRGMKVIFSPDGSQIVGYSGDTLCIWNTDNGELSFHRSLTDNNKKLSLRFQHLSSPPPPHLAFRSTDHQLITCSGFGVVRAWRLEDGALAEDTSISSPQPTRANSAVEIRALSPDGLTVFARDLGGTRYLWSTRTCDSFLRLTYPGARDFGMVAAFSPSGKLFAAMTLSDLLLWNTKTEEFTQSPVGDSTGHLTFSSDNHHIAYSRGSVFRICNVHTGHLVTPWDAHTTTICALAFSPDGKKLVSCSKDGQTRIWDTIDLVEGSDSSIGLLGVHMRDGWMMDNDNELMFWVPKDHRGGLVWPRNTAVIGGTGIPTELNFTEFRYGKNWTQCFIEAGDK